MSKFKLGDKVRGKYNPDLTGTVILLGDEEVVIKLDSPSPGVMRDTGKEIMVMEGWAPEDLLELVEESDWKSMWDRND